MLLNANGWSNTRHGNPNKFFSLSRWGYDLASYIFFVSLLSSQSAVQNKSLSLPVSLLCPSIAHSLPFFTSAWYALNWKRQTSYPILLCLFVYVFVCVCERTDSPLPFPALPFHFFTIFKLLFFFCCVSWLSWSSTLCCFVDFHAARQQDQEKNAQGGIDWIELTLSKVKQKPKSNKTHARQKVQKGARSQKKKWDDPKYHLSLSLPAHFFLWATRPTLLRK